MQVIADWLDKLGLGQYAQRFAENDISFSVLPDLTDQHLKEIGVSLGHRLQLLRAIANLDKAAVASAPAIGRPPTATTPVAPLAEAAGERRHVTVLFCDLVDSTGIAARLDAEEWRDVVGAYLDAVSAAVTEMGGKVAKKLGDGLMALFGYPVAQENDAERAVRAALSIQRALAELNRKNEGTGKPALAARIAIDLGPVVVDTAGEIFGEVPNITARAQALAEPGAVVVTARVQRQVAGLFVAEERGSHELKGVPEPVTLLPDRPSERRWAPRRPAPPHAARGSRRGNRHADAALGAGAAGRRTIGADRRRAWAGQVSPDRGVSRPTARDAAHLGRVELLRSSCRTRRCIRSPNGAGNGSVAPTFLPSGVWQTWRTRWLRSNLTRQKISHCSRRSSIFRSRKDRAPPLTAEELRRRQLAALTTG